MAPKKEAFAATSSSTRLSSHKETAPTSRPTLKSSDKSSGASKEDITRFTAIKSASGRDYSKAKGVARVLKLSARKKKYTSFHAGLTVGPWDDKEDQSTQLEEKEVMDASDKGLDKEESKVWRSKRLANMTKPSGSQA